MNIHGFIRHSNALFRSFGSWRPLLALLSLAACVAPSAGAQAIPTAQASAAVGGYVTFGGNRTHVINYTFNSLGAGAGFYIQHSSLIGLEFRGADYQLHARFSQMPITGGFRFVSNHDLWGRFQISGFAGAGLSKSEGSTIHYRSTHSEWDPCFQLSQGTAIPFGHWRWRLYDASWTRTYNSTRTLDSLTVTTGLGYSFTR